MFVVIILINRAQQLSASSAESMGRRYVEAVGSNADVRNSSFTSAIVSKYANGDDAVSSETDHAHDMADQNSFIIRSAPGMNEVSRINV